MRARHDAGALMHAGASPLFYTPLLPRQGNALRRHTLNIDDPPPPCYAYIFHKMIFRLDAALPRLRFSRAHRPIARPISPRKGATRCYIPAVLFLNKTIARDDGWPHFASSYFISFLRISHFLMTQGRQH